MALFEDAEAKGRLIPRFENFVRRQLRGFSPPCATPKVFTVPIDEQTRRDEFAVFKAAPHMLPEEYYQYSLIKVLFTEIFEQASEHDADVLFLPMHLPVYSVCEIDLAGALRASALIDSPKPKFGVFSWDTYPRPPFSRANPFCPLGQGILELSSFHLGCRDWMDDSWYIAVTESTIDRHPNDFALALLPAPYKSRFEKTDEDKFLYSFCGRHNYDSMPSSHIRGDGFEHVWQALASSRREDVFVGSLADAQAAFTEKANYRDFSQNSTFTLCPAGWGRWSFRLYEAIQDGSIPVILSDYYELPFESRVPWSDFSLRLPEAALPDIDAILRALRPERIAQLKRGNAVWRDAFGVAGLAKNICLEASQRLCPA